MLAAAIAGWRRELAGAAEGSARLEGAFSVLLSSLESWKMQMRETAGRAETRTLLGLEALEAQVKKPQEALDELSSRLAYVLGAQEESNARLERELESLAAALEDRSKWLATGLAGRLNALEARASATEDASSQNWERLFSGLERLSAGILEGQSTVAAEIRENLMDGLRAIDARLDRQEALREETARATTRKLAGALEELKNDLAHSAGEAEGRLRRSFESLEACINDRVGSGLNTLETKIRKREESMLALILGGAPAAPGVPGTADPVTDVPELIEPPDPFD